MSEAMVSIGVRAELPPRYKVKVTVLEVKLLQETVFTPPPSWRTALGPGAENSLYAKAPATRVDKMKDNFMMDRWYYVSMWKLEKKTDNMDGWDVDR